MPAIGIRCGTIFTTPTAGLCLPYGERTEAGQSRVRIFSYRSAPTNQNERSSAKFDDAGCGCYDRVAGWSSLVARWAHNPKVGGSNPPPATNLFKSSPETWVTECTGHMGNAFGPNGFSSGSKTLVSKSK